jgi:hypothetical protein
VKAALPFLSISAAALSTSVLVCFACSEGGGAYWEIAGEAAASNVVSGKPTISAFAFIATSIL